MDTNILNIIKDTSLEYHEKRASLAYHAENTLPYTKISKRSQDYLSNKIICDIFEGHAPYRPRYLLPDYAKYLKNGSQYLNIQSPSDIYEAINALLIIYRYVPSITGYPVYLGQLDDLLEPYCDDVGNAQLKPLIKMFLNNIDRTLPDAFVHANIGPRDTRVGRLILETERELKNAIPNLSLKTSVETPDEFLRLAVDTALTISKPYFVNHDVMKAELSENYGIASCYNALKIGGGAHTLVRLNLKELASQAPDVATFMSTTLVDAVESLCEIIDARARFVVEEASFFNTSFLAVERLIDISNFTSMAGIFGLYDCIDILTRGSRMGMDADADELAHAITSRVHALVKSHNGAYCDGYGGKIGVHAQSGIDSDVDVSEGVRFRAGAEPQLAEQIMLQARLQKYFDAGASDIYVFDKSARDNVDGVVTIVRGAMKHGLKTMAISSNDSELVRITGYLVKKTDLANYDKGIKSREDSVVLGARHIKSGGVYKRLVRSVPGK